MTQSELIIRYIKEYGKFTPAKKANSSYMRNGVQIGWFGSSVDSLCRKLRLYGDKINGEFIQLKSHRDGKYETFYFERQSEKKDNRILRPISYQEAMKIESNRQIYG